MRQVPKFASILGVVMGAEIGNNLLTPLLAFIFFSSNSTLFLADTSMVKRSWLFGLCLTLYKAGGVAANFVVTTLSDYYGRKLGLYCSHSGLLILSILGFTALYLHSPFLLIAGYTFLGLLYANLAIGPAIISDMSHGENRVKNMATIQCILALGACIGPIIGGKLGAHTWLLNTAYALPFLVIGLVAVISLSTIHYCPETLIERKEISWQDIWHDYKSIFLSKDLRWLLLLLVLCQMSWGSYYEFISPILKNIFHYAPQQVGLFVGLIAFWLVLASSIGIRLLLKIFNHRQMFWWSSLGLMLGTLFNLIAGQNANAIWSMWIMWVGAIFIAMSDVIFFTLLCTKLTEQISAAQRGKAMGLILTLAIGVWSLMALLGGAILSVHFNAILWLIPVGAIFLFLVLSFKGDLA